MKVIEKFEDLPKEVIDYFGFDEEDEDSDVTWEEIMDDIIHLIKNEVGYNGEPKRKKIDGLDHYVHRFVLKIGKLKLIGETKQYIKEFPNVICYEEPHRLLIKKTLF